jgi:hypothetical protein
MHTDYIAPVRTNMSLNRLTINRFIANIALLLTCLICYQTSWAQYKSITGTVVDSATQSPIQNTSLKIKGSSRGAITDAKGLFTVTVPISTKQIVFTHTGYNAITLHLTDETHQTYTVHMSLAYTRMSDVVVKYKKSKYRNKNNPAVELIRQVIDHKDSNQIRAYPYTTYREYEKKTISLDKIPTFLLKPKMLQKYRFLFDNIDSTKYPGKKLIPIYISETLTDNYYRRHPPKTKQILRGEKAVNYGEFIDMKGIANLLNRVYEPVNIYENNISLFTTMFLSPISTMAPTFYMYFITDTVVEDHIKLVKLNFMPRNPDDLLFRGTLYVTLDGHYAVKKAELMVSKHSNLNYVREFRVNLQYTRDTSQRYYLTLSDMIADFGVTKNTIGVFGERSFDFSQFTSPASLPDSIFKGPSVDTTVLVKNPNDTIWTQSRATPLTASEQKAYLNVDSLTGMKSYKRLMDYATVLTAGYKQAGPFEIGPLATFYTFNPVEGNKYRVGGRSTIHLSRRYFVEGYAAYGTTDQKWKYYGSATYSINNKSIIKYPYNYIQTSYQYDTRTPGQLDGFSQESSYSSIKRGDNTKWLYNHIFRINYVHEFGDHLSYNLGLRYWQQQPAGSIEYIYQKTPTDPDTVSSLTTTELSATLRWAPHEQYFEGKVGRGPIANKYPIFTFRYAHGVKGLMGGQYNYNDLHLNIYKRFYLSPFGYSDVTFDAGYITGKLPFPLLQIPTANQSYAYYIDQYNMMNFEEFVNDHYIGLDIDHYFNGFFFNKVPFLKWLKLREVIAGKILFGGVRDENNPALTADQMKFPTSGGLPATFILNNGPYIEASAGVTNIFKLVRVDMVHRFTYLNNPNVAPWGLRFRVKFDF